jgi:hypothetical protein
MDILLSGSETSLPGFTGNIEEVYCKIREEGKRFPAKYTFDDFFPSEGLSFRQKTAVLSEAANADIIITDRFVKKTL